MRGSKPPSAWSATGRHNDKHASPSVASMVAFRPEVIRGFGPRSSPRQFQNIIGWWLPATLAASWLTQICAWSRATQRPQSAWHWETCGARAATPWPSGPHWVGAAAVGVTCATGRGLERCATPTGASLWANGIDSLMIEPLENFETWLLIWTAANLGSFREGDDLSVWVRLRADELTQDATHAGFYGELVEAAKPYGGVEGYIQNKLEEVRRWLSDPSARALIFDDWLPV